MASNQELWRTVIRFPKYEVSTLGRVRSWADGNGGLRKAPRVLTPNMSRGRYPSVALYDPHKKAMRCVNIHRLVLEAFSSACPVGYQAGHLDGNPQNNRFSNLAWLTPKENAQQRYRHGNQPEGSRSNLAKLTDEKVAAIRQLHALGWTNISQLSRIFGCSRQAISDITNNKTWRRLRAVGVSEEELQ